jgi:hypothetical protein
MPTKRAPVRKKPAWLGIIRPEQVVDPETFATYAQQTLGCPYPPLRDMILLRTKIKEFFAEKPQADYYTLCRIVQWAKANKRRPAAVWKIPPMWAWAWEDNALPELDPDQLKDKDLERRIALALEVETDPAWRRRLIGSESVEKRREVYDSWKAAKKAAREANS